MRALKLSEQIRNDFRETISRFSKDIRQAMDIGEIDKMTFKITIDRNTVSKRDQIEFTAQRIEHIEMMFEEDVKL